MKIDYSTKSHEDDSVTLTVGEYVVHIRGPSWRASRDLAHTIASLTVTRRDIDEARAKLKRTLDVLDELHRATLELARSLE